jgi:putative two-component system response regulator
MIPDYEELQRLPILAVDDDETSLVMLRATLEGAGYTHLTTTPDPTLALGLFAQTRPRLVLLDLYMPKLDGFDLMRRLAPLTDEGRGVPFLVVTADGTAEIKRQALSAGARDFLTKPVDQVELLLRVRNMLLVAQLQHRLVEQNVNLEKLVVQRTRDVEHARLETLERLAHAADHRDGQTLAHALRVARTSALIAHELGWPDVEADRIRRAAQLHDIGKIGVSDALLLKTGPLTAEESDALKQHTTIGAQILCGRHSAVLAMAESIAVAHHERWDGGGYPSGLSGEAIPLAARVVAVADAFDALVHGRPEKAGRPADQAVAEIANESGRQFDPSVVEAFSRLSHAALVSPACEREFAGVSATPHVGAPRATPV